MDWGQASLRGHIVVFRPMLDGRCMTGVPTQPGSGTATSLRQAHTSVLVISGSECTLRGPGELGPNIEATPGVLAHLCPHWRTLPPIAGQVQKLPNPHHAGLKPLDPPGYAGREAQRPRGHASVLV